MRKFNYLFSAFVLMSLIGCQSEEDVFGNDTSNRDYEVITASFEQDAESRTALGEDGRSVVWQKGDQISVFWGNTTNEQYVLVNGEGETTADFEGTKHIISGSTGTIDKTWKNVAYYPYDKDITIAKNEEVYELSVTLPSTQYYAVNSFGQNASPYVAVEEVVSNNAKFMFKNVGAIIGIKLKGNATITKVILSSASNPLAGAAVVKTNGVEPTIELDSETASKSIVLDCGDGVALDSETYTKFTFIIPPTTFEAKDLTFTVYDNEGKYQAYNIEAKNVFKRNSHLVTSKSYDNPQEVVKVKLNDEGSYTDIASAVQAITDNSTENTITLAAGTYTLPTSLSGLNLVIEGENADLPGEVVIDMSTGDTPQFGANSVTFKNLTMKRKADSYGGLSHTTAEHYDNCIIEGTLVTYATTVTVKNSQFVPGATEYYNVHIYEAGSSTFENCTFTAAKGRSVYAHAETAKQMDIKFSNCTFNSNEVNSEKYGPAIRLHTELGIYGTLNIENCSNNQNFNTAINGGLWVEWNNNTKDITYNFTKKIDGVNPDGYEKVEGKENEYNIFNANGLVYAAKNLFANGGTFNITDDIDMTGVAYPSIKFESDNAFVINGKEHTIKGLNNPLIASTWSAVKVEIKDLTLDGTTFNIEDNNNGVACFIGYAEASETITIDNCHVVNAEIEGGHWIGGFVGYAAGFNEANNGPVFETLTIKDCSVKNSSIVGHDTSCGAIIGHATGSVATLVKIENATVTGNTITTDEDNKAGSILGTVGTAGKEAWNGQYGGTYVTDAEVSNNTVKANNVANTKIYGRQGSEDGVLYVDGVQVVFTAEQLAASLLQDVAAINLVLGGDIDVPITSLGTQTGGSGEYKLGGTNTSAITIDLGGNKLNITTTYWSAIGAKNDNAM